MLRTGVTDYVTGRDMMGSDRDTSQEKAITKRDMMSHSCHAARDVTRGVYKTPCLSRTTRSEPEVRPPASAEPPASGRATRADTSTQGAAWHRLWDLLISGESSVYPEDMV